MSPQHDLDLANNSGAAFRSDLNLALEALQTNSSGATEIVDADSKAYQFWADTGSSPAVMKMRNGADNGWITLFNLDGSSLPIASATEIVFNDAGADLDFRIEGDTEANLFFVDAGNDRVGIGTNVPTYNLDVESSGDTVIRARSSTTANPSFILSEDNNTKWKIESVNNSDNRLRIVNQSGTEVADIDQSGVLNITSTASNGKITLGHANNYLYGDTSNNFIVGTGGSDRLAIDNSGRVLLQTSTTSTNDLLLIQGYAGYSTEYGTFGLRRGTDPGSADTIGIINFYGNSSNLGARISAKRDGGTWTSGSSHPGSLHFFTVANGSTSAAERMRINSAGFLKASDSTTYVSATGSFHEMANSVSGQDTLRITQRASSNPYGVIIEFPSAAPDNNSNYFLNCVDSSAQRLLIFSDGDVKNHDNSYGSLSDEKLKQDIVDAGSQWDDLKNLRVRKFKFKSDVEAYGDNAKTLIGLVAQEVETVSPGLVKESPDMDAENNDLGTTTKSVTYSVLYMKAVKALQEAMERIETLEAKVAALESA